MNIGSENPKNKQTNEQHIDVKKDDLHLKWRDKMTTPQTITRNEPGYDKIIYLEFVY